MSTQIQNVATHPGIPDQKNKCHSSAEVAAGKKMKADKKAAKECLQSEKIKVVAEMEDQMAIDDQDADKDAAHPHPNPL
jgi:hypothetical protein